MSSCCETETDSGSDREAKTEASSDREEQKRNWRLGTNSQGGRGKTNKSGDKGTRLRSRRQTNSAEEEAAAERDSRESDEEAN